MLFPSRTKVRRRWHPGGPRRQNSETIRGQWWEGGKAGKGVRVPSGGDLAWKSSVRKKPGEKTHRSDCILGASLCGAELEASKRRCCLAGEAQPPALWKQGQLLGLLTSLSPHLRVQLNPHLPNTPFSCPLLLQLNRGSWSVSSKSASKEEAELKAKPQTFAVCC